MVRLRHAYSCSLTEHHHTAYMLLPFTYAVKAQGAVTVADDGFQVIGLAAEKPNLLKGILYRLSVYTGVKRTEAVEKQFVNMHFWKPKQVLKMMPSYSQYVTTDKRRIILSFRQSRKAPEKTILNVQAYDETSIGFHTGSLETQ